MNLEEKAIQYAIDNTFVNRKTETVFKAGAIWQLGEVKEFIRANPKATAEQILKHLEELK